MAGLYIHIPFCRSRCIYCGFYSTTALTMRQQYVDAVCQEMIMRGDQHISTIYLGGGTPSQLTIPQLEQIFAAVYKYNKVEEKAEVTIECNPDDVTEEFASALSRLPVNRVSMGGQTFDDNRLRFLHRRHSAAQVTKAVERVRAAGITNISIDLMYGFPQESLADWERDINHALALRVEHLSSYCLMIEEGTELWRKVESGKWKENTEEAEREMYYTLIDRLETAGYEHYEISNFARKGFRSRHNSCYWNGTPYIGIGAAAHSYDIKTRSWNVSDLFQYINGIHQGKRIYEEETIDDDTRYNDAVTTALRTRDGLQLSTLPERHQVYCLQNARCFIENGLLELTGKDGKSASQILRLTRRGLFVSDMIMSELMFV